jgi:hypothetical protein
MKRAVPLIAALAVVGIGILAADVHTDYSHSTDFRAYHTYKWLKVDAGNSLWADRIRQDVDQQLQAKGLTQQQGSSDLSVAALGSLTEQRSFTTFYDGLGASWFWHGEDGGMSTTTEDTIPVGNLTVDLFDSNSKKLVWRGTSSKTLSGDPEKNSKKLSDDIADMFRTFPPKGE